MRTALAAPDLAFVTQDPPRGTGDAARQALAALPDDGVTLITNGDCPLIPAATFAALSQAAAKGKLVVLTARPTDPLGLGRVDRATDGSVRAIVEESDATPAQRAIDEIYTGTLAAPTPLLRRFVSALSDDNAQREYYLTDVVKLAVAAGVPVEAHVAADAEIALGVNDRAQLAAIERRIQARRADALDEGGRLACRSRAYRHPRHARLRARRGDRRGLRSLRARSNWATASPWPVLRAAQRDRRGEYRDRRVLYLEQATIGARCRIGPYARFRPGVVVEDEVHIGNFVEVKASRPRSRRQGQSSRLRRRRRLAPASTSAPARSRRTTTVPPSIAP
jgi:bifunctional UDP-N-acetylglucosamine pyrophosphorylase/glucosamine-1-phosphate N-acetyltransferase